MFDHLATSLNIVWQAEKSKLVPRCFWKNSKTFSDCHKQNLFVIKCFATWPNGPTSFDKTNFRCWMNNVWSFSDGLRVLTRMDLKFQHQMGWFGQTRSNDGIASGSINSSESNTSIRYSQMGRTINYDLLAFITCRNCLAAVASK